MGRKNIRQYKGSSLLAFFDDYIVIDLETTGLDTKHDEIIEVGALKIKNNSIINSYHTLVKPDYPIDSFIQELTGITNEMVNNAPTIDHVLPDILSFIDGSVIVGHCVHFDVNFLYDNCMRYLGQPFSNNLVDTMRISRHLNKELGSHSLYNVLQYYNIINDDPHRSIGDCVATNKLYQQMKLHSEDMNIDIEVIRKPLRAKDISTSKKDFETTHPLHDRICVFTGTLDHMTRKDAMQMVVDVGGMCEDNVTKRTNYLVLGDYNYCTQIKGNKSNKLKKAERMILNGHDITIISENVFYDIIETAN